MKNDFSKEIFENYFNAKDSALEITLNDGTVLEGYLVGFSHGEGSNEPFSLRWHFVDEADIDDYRKMFSIGGEEVGQSIEQKTSKSVKFKRT